MRPRRRFLVLATWPWLARAQVAFDAAAKVEVGGDVKRTLRLGRDELAVFAAADQVTSSVTRQVDGRDRQTTTRGVRLKAVLEQAGLAERDRADWRKTVVLATARDGYRVAFSWPELFNTEAGAQVMLVYERDGAPLGADEGPIAILAPADLRSGPRHVKWLVRIDVRILRD